MSRSHSHYWLNQKTRGYYHKEIYTSNPLMMPGDWEHRLFCENAQIKAKQIKREIENLSIKFSLNVSNYALHLLNNTPTPSVLWLYL